MKTQPAPQPTGQPARPRSPSSGQPDGPAGSATTSPRLPRQQWRADAWFALAMLALGSITVYLLSQGGAALQPVASTPAAPANIAVRTHQPTGQTLAAGIVGAGTREYVFAQANIGLMRPAVDPQGNLWFGEMSANRLARLDPRTQRVTTWQPPHGRYNIMSTASDTQGNIWFVEQAANYIGKFDPTTQRFTTYPLEVTAGRIAAPQDLRFDQNGMLWFTEINSAKIGRLNPATGAITTWAIPVLPGATQTFPFSLTIAPDGGVWFGEISGGAIGLLDPATGAIHLYPLPTRDAQIFSTAADSLGRIWFTELEQGNIGWVDPRSGRVTEKAVPQTLGRAAGLYDVVASPNGTVWFACASVNALVRYTPTSDAFTFYQLATPNSVPYGLTLDGSGALWFTADAAPNNYVGTLLT